MTWIFRCRSSVLCFTARDHTTVVAALPSDLKVVDLSADFRLRDPADYEKWYGKPHAAVDLQAQAVYGLTEFYRDDIRNARLVAGTGCTPRPASSPSALIEAAVIDLTLSSSILRLA